MDLTLTSQSTEVTRQVLAETAINKSLTFGLIGTAFLCGAVWGVSAALGYKVSAVAYYKFKMRMYQYFYEFEVRNKTSDSLEMPPLLSDNSEEINALKVEAVNSILSHKLNTEGILDDQLIMDCALEIVAFLQG